MRLMTVTKLMKRLPAPGIGSRALCLTLAVALGLATGGCEGDSGAADEGGTTLTVGPGRWEPLAPLPGPSRAYVGVAAARGKVFVVGGHQSPEQMRLASAFDTTTLTWEQLAPLPVPCPMANAVGVHDRLFVLGCLEDRNTLEYDFATGGWVPRAPSPLERGHGYSTIGVSGDLVLLAGGLLRGLSPNMLATGQRTQDLVVYDTKRDTWETGPSTPVAVGYAMGAVVGQQFFVIGGSYVARTAEVLIFDLKARTWSTGVPLPTTLSSGVAGVIGGKIVVAGGIATGTGMISPNTLLFDPAHPDTGWTTLTPIKTPRFATGSAVIANKLYVPTGMGLGPDGPVDFRALPDFEVFLPQ
jgi:hypothetical protein